MSKGKRLNRKKETRGAPKKKRRKTAVSEPSISGGKAVVSKRAGPAQRAKGPSGSTKISSRKRSVVAASFPVVGIGASAGGLEALEELLGNMPPDTGMAFVVVTHQHPDHTSLLPELLGKCTTMPVTPARDGLRVERNCVYVNPPGKHLALMKNVLHLMAGPKGEMPPLPIDSFFRSLAQDQNGRAICIVLSGTGADGTLGLRAVKAEDGIAIVQEVQSARYAGMPSSAIATSLADYVLPPAAMAAQLVACAQGTSIRKRSADDAPVIAVDVEEHMQKIFVLLRTHTGHDFSSYKSTTLHRRIERRIGIHRIKGAKEYVRLLEENPREIDILFKELLIGVTSFFRNPDSFKTLARKALPELMASRPDNYVFRAWVPGCGTGEEAYTLALILHECAKRMSKPFGFQIFGTDLDADSIKAARTGRYSKSITEAVPVGVLKRHFSLEEGTYCIHKNIREMLVFAQQNVIRDPPFTKLDLLVCRNLLIYFNADLQEGLLPIFHHALKPEGLLMLGPSETIGGASDMFSSVDKKWKIFRRRETPATAMLPQIPAQPSRARTSGTIISSAPASKAHMQLASRPVPEVKGRAGKPKRVTSKSPSGTSARVEELEQELQRTRESFQATVEELETANEELQSTNEEFQSANEELETSREEMQSLNEELTTVNAELQSKLDQLSRTNDDMQNLLNGTDIATIFLDSDLNIKRYTEQAKKIVKMIPTDIGRPIEDLMTSLAYDGMVRDAKEVLTTLQRKEMEVPCKDGVWHLMRMMPYRTADNAVDGVVITFVDIDKTKRAEEASTRAWSFFEDLFQGLREPVIVLNQDLRVVASNVKFCETFLIAPKQTKGELIYEMGEGEWDVRGLRKLLEEIIPKHTSIENFEITIHLPKTGARAFLLNARQIEREPGMSGLIMLAMEAVTSNGGAR